MTTATSDVTTTQALRASRTRVPRSRGALGGLLVLLLGAWAGLVPFIGPYFDFGFGPRPGTAWHWTSGFGWIDVVGGAAAFVGGLLLLISASRVVTSFGGWLAAAGGAWLVVGPTLDPITKITLGGPDPSLSTDAQALEQLFYFCAVGAAIVLLAGIALGRLSVHSLRDVRAAERRNAADSSRAYERDRIAAADTHARVGSADDGEQRWTPDGNGRHEQPPT